MTNSEPATAPPKFGTVFSESMAIARFEDGSWSALEMVSPDSITFHPATHALHYGSACFEGLKAHRHPDGSVHAFRADDHVRRLVQSAARLCLPAPPNELLAAAITDTVEANAAATPEPPGSLYLRPVLMGTDLDIGAAATPSRSALLYVLASPVGEYLPPRPLRIVVETEIPRTTPQFGVVKTGANYAMALGVIGAAREQHGADQVLFAPDGAVEETGAANVVLLADGHLLTPALTDGFLHGVTRDSLLRLVRDRGWTVEERAITVDDVREWIARPSAEMALTGTAAVLASVGELIVDGAPIAVGSGSTSLAAELRTALTDVQTGRAQATWV
ncbi:MAG: branched-chain-amino-acid transaminase [Actinomycetota bacterium]